MGIGVVLVLVVSSLVGACARDDAAQHVEAVRAVLSGDPSWIGRGELDEQLWDIERQFYEQRQHLPAWLAGTRITPHAKELIRQLLDAKRHGLDPARYDVRTLEEAGDRVEPEQVAELDARFTNAYLQHAADLLGWRSNPRAVSRSWIVTPKKENLVARLEAALAGPNVRESLEALAPSHSQYKGLQVALAAEEQTPTGRADVLRINLERWRWAPRDLGERHVLINVPAYQMQIVEREHPVLAMRVIVGAPDTPTPIFSDDMTYIVFSPYWNIPESILREETLPRLASDPDYLRRNNLEVVDAKGQPVDDASSIDWEDESVTKAIRLRQAPGPENALGLVKFIFPNNFNVYLHDTPSDKLFFRESRALSHGCIRVEKPVALAQYVLRDQPQWTESRIASAMDGKDEQVVTLKQKLPVHIGYWTAWVEADGKMVTYTQDPYGLDAKQLDIAKAAAASTAARDAAANHL